MNGSILIPEKFKLNGVAIKVLINDAHCETGECIGEANFELKVITLCKKYNNLKLSKKTKEKVFFHELIHMILDSMGKNSLKFNEDFVDEFANRLYEFEKTKQ